MGRTEINHPQLGLMWTVPRAAAALQISRSEMKRRIKDEGEQFVTWQRRKGAWQYVTVASVESAAGRYFPPVASASPGQ